MLGIKTTGAADYQSAEAIDEIDSSISEVSKGNQSFFMYSVCIGLIGESKEDIESQGNSLEKTFCALHDTQLIRDDFNHRKNFMSLLPGYNEDTAHKHLLLTKPASVLLPFEQDFEGTPGVQTLFRSVSGGLIPFSLFENQFPSSNMMIVAPIRTGK